MPTVLSFFPLTLFPFLSIRSYFLCYSSPPLTMVNRQCIRGHSSPAEREQRTLGKEDALNKKIAVRFLFILFWGSYFHTATAGEGEHVLSDELKALLTSESYIYVATRRLNGEWSTAAPVWFMYDGEAVYFTTSPSSHKAHRIHRGSPVRVWVGRKDGPTFDGEAQLVKDRAIVERMAEAYNKKYWLSWLGFFRPRPARVGSGKTVVVKVTPVASMP